MTHTETLHKKLIRLVLPISFQQFMLALVGASDAFMLGRLNQNSMSAVSLASQITFVFNLFMAAFIIGENMFVAQYYGKKDKPANVIAFGSPCKVYREINEQDEEYYFTDRRFY